MAMRAAATETGAPLPAGPGLTTLCGRALVPSPATICAAAGEAAGEYRMIFPEPI